MSTTTPPQLRRQREYRLLTTGATVSAFGNAIAPVALAFAVLDLGGSATELGLVVAAYAVAEVLTTLLGGVLGDRLPRKVLMQGSAAAAAATQTVIAASLLGGWSSVVLLGVVGLVNGCLAALSGPSSAAMTRLTVTEALLPQAVSVRRLLQNGAQIAGFSLAGVIVAAFGSGWALAVDAATFAVAAGCFAAMRATGDLRVQAGSSLRQDLRVGAAEVIRHTWLWLLIGQALLYHLFYGGAQGVLGPIVVRERFDEAAWGWALGALMVGFLMGGLVSLRWRPGRGLFVGTGLLTLTAAFPLALALTDSLPLLLAAAAMHGFGLEVFTVNWDLTIQRHVAPDKLARVYAFDLVGSYLARPIGLALTAPVAEAVGFVTWLLIVAGVMLGSTLLVLVAPSVRRMSNVSRTVEGGEDATT